MFVVRLGRGWVCRWFSEKEFYKILRNVDWRCGVSFIVEDDYNLVVSFLVLSVYFTFRLSLYIIIDFFVVSKLGVFGFIYFREIIENVFYYSVFYSFFFLNLLDVIKGFVKWFR